ncbi:MAG: sensor domain-containing diguanylate cyclase [Bacillota bacterium]
MSINLDIDVKRIDKKYLEPILRALPEIIILLDKTGNYLDILTADSNDLVDDKENLIGENVKNVLPPAEAEKFIELCQSCFKDEEVKSFEYDLLLDGKRNYFEALFSAVDSEDNIGEVIVASIRNITKLKETEQRLQEHQAYFKQLFNNSTEAICLLDNNHCVIQVNKKFEKLFGYKEDEIKGQNLDDFLLPIELKSKGRNYTEQVKKGGKVIDETVRMSKDGRGIDVFMQGFPINLPNGQIGIYALYTDISERKKKEREIRYLSFHDEMTGLYNRRYFETELERLESSRDLPIAIIIGDVDGLKIINDNYGHKSGDKFIKSAAKVLSGASRSEDIAARIGGDEYAVVLPATDAEAAAKYCQRIKDEIDKFNLKNYLPQKLSISLGYSVLEDDTQSLEDVFNQADQQMYINKGRK